MGRRSLHHGIDLTAWYERVYALMDGRAEDMDYDGRYGLWLWITHDSGLHTSYGHLSKFIVRNDQRVKAGTVLGIADNTGLSTGPHLHYMIVTCDKIKYEGR
jgi:murein DD-endopeptidase MepM/ murein hydrolase activator NlpD